MKIRSLEKSSKNGYLFYISYKGSRFQSFDENKDKKSVKGEFIRILKEIGITWAKGVQQAGRTDAGVSANENILYISTNYNGSREALIKKFNEKTKDMSILRIEKTLANLVLPDMVEAREYIYKYPTNKITKSIDEIRKTCEELSGEYDVSPWTDSKGEKLKEKIRMIEVSYDGEELLFYGNSFMPKQVRIMSAYILSGEKKIFPSKYLTLNKIILKDDLLKWIFKEDSNIRIENVAKVEVSDKLKIFYVKKEKKSELIGKKGINIKKLRKDYGKLIVREI